jgi:hypothetical protein
MRHEDPIIRAAIVGTAVFTVVAIAAAALPDQLAVVAVVVDLVLFAAGIVAFVGALLKAADRSRTEAVTLAGVFWLSGTAPHEARRPLLGALAVEVAVALVTAGVRPFTGLAFGVLVPVYALGLTGLWGARHGTFAARS